MSERQNHLSTDTWERLACGELPGVKEGAARAHIAACEDCRATWTALTDLREAAETFDPGLREPLPEPLRPRFGAPSTWMPLAAAAILTAVVGVGFWQRQAPSPTLPEMPPTASERAGADAAPVPGFPPEGSVGDVAGFSWQGSPAVDRYEVEILGADGSLLWRSEELDRLQTLWPNEIVKIPGTYYWRVVAFDNGQAISSELVRFEIAQD